MRALSVVLLALLAESAVAWLQSPASAVPTRPANSVLRHCAVKPQNLRLNGGSDDIESWDSDVYWKSDADPETYRDKPLFPLFSDDFIEAFRSSMAQANHIVLLEDVEEDDEEDDEDVGESCCCASCVLAGHGVKSLANSPKAQPNKAPHPVHVDDDARERGEAMFSKWSNLVWEGTYPPQFVPPSSPPEQATAGVSEVSSEEAQPEERRPLLSAQWAAQRGEPTSEEEGGRVYVVLDDEKAGLEDLSAEQEEVLEPFWASKGVSKMEADAEDLPRATFVVEALSKVCTDVESLSTEEAKASEAEDEGEAETDVEVVEDETSSAVADPLTQRSVLQADDDNRSVRPFAAAGFLSCLLPAAPNEVLQGMTSASLRSNMAIRGGRGDRKLELVADEYGTPRTALRHETNDDGDSDFGDEYGTPRFAVKREDKIQRSLARRAGGNKQTAKGGQSDPVRATGQSSGVEVELETAVKAALDLQRESVGLAVPRKAAAVPTPAVSTAALPNTQTKSRPATANVTKASSSSSKSSLKLKALQPQWTRKPGDPLPAAPPKTSVSGKAMVPAAVEKRLVTFELRTKQEEVQFRARMAEKRAWTLSRKVQHADQQTKKVQEQVKVVGEVAKQALARAQKKMRDADDEREQVLADLRTDNERLRRENRELRDQVRHLSKSQPLPVHDETAGSPPSAAAGASGNPPSRSIASTLQDDLRKLEAIKQSLSGRKKESTSTTSLPPSHQGPVAAKHGFSGKEMSQHQQHGRNSQGVHSEEEGGRTSSSTKEAPAQKENVAAPVKHERTRPDKEEGAGARTAAAKGDRRAKTKEGEKKGTKGAAEIVERVGKPMHRRRSGEVLTV